MFPLITGEFSEPAAVFTSLNSGLCSLIHCVVKGNAACRHLNTEFALENLFMVSWAHPGIGGGRAGWPFPPLHYWIASSFHIFPS